MNRRILKAELETRESERVVFSTMPDMEVEKLTTGMEVQTISKNDNVDMQEDLKADSNLKTLKPESLEPENHKPESPESESQHPPKP